MQESAYQVWLRRHGKEPATLSTSLSTLRRIEGEYGPLDDAFVADGLEGLLSEFAYSKTDERAGAPNPTRLRIAGDVYSTLSSCRTHLNYYRRFLEARDTEADVVRAVETVAAVAAPVMAVQPDEPPEAILSLERDLQAALRASITQIEPGLTIIDGGRERSVPSGRIDILAAGADGSTVVIELKAVRAGRDAVGQVLAYMGDIDAEGGQTVRGVLIAPDFDPRAESAARMVPGLTLLRFSFRFAFDPVTPRR